MTDSSNTTPTPPSVDDFQAFSWHLGHVVEMVQVAQKLAKTVDQKTEVEDLLDGLYNLQYSADEGTLREVLQP